jgi:hypothetical protein
MLVDRLRAAIRVNQQEDLAKSVRIQTKKPTSDHLTSYIALLTALEGGGLEQGVIAGWWEGWAKDVVVVMPDEGEHVALEPGTDLDWLVWRTTWEQVVRVVRETHLEPGLLVSPLLGWVLFSPPGSNDMFLYPELSASG